MNNTIFELTIFGAGSVVNGTDAYVNANDSASSESYNGGGLSPEIKTFYDKALIELAKPNLIHTQFGQKRPVPLHGGKTVEFRRMTPLEKNLNTISEGVTPTGSKMKVVPLTATLNQYGDYIEQTDLLEMTAVDNTVLEATKLLADQAGRTIDTVVRDVLHTGTNVIYASRKAGNNYYSVGSRSQLDENAKLRAADIFKAAACLKAANAPTIDGKYVGIIHPHVAFDLMQEAGGAWIDIKKYAEPEKLLEGEIGTLGGVRFVVSSEAKINFGKDLAPDNRCLSVYNVENGNVTKSATVGETTGFAVYVNEDIDESLVGRRVGYSGPEVADGIVFTVKGVNPAEKAVFGDYYCDEFYSTGEDMLFPGEGGKDGKAAYSTLFLGADAYGLIDVGGKGTVEHIVKQRGYGNDPLDQRSSVGWKAYMCAVILADEYIMRVESGSTFSPFVSEAN